MACDARSGLELNYMWAFHIFPLSVRKVEPPVWGWKLLIRAHDSVILQAKWPAPPAWGRNLVKSVAAVV
jgi:hypothetical protein